MRIFKFASTWPDRFNFQIHRPDHEPWILLTHNLIEKIRQFLARNTYRIFCRSFWKYVLSNPGVLSQIIACYSIRSARRSPLLSYLGSLLVDYDTVECCHAERVLLAWAQLLQTYPSPIMASLSSILKRCIK